VKYTQEELAVATDAALCTEGRAFSAGAPYALRNAWQRVLAMLYRLQLLPERRRSQSIALRLAYIEGYRAAVAEMKRMEQPSAGAVRTKPATQQEPEWKSTN
jgi:hypothetical protein